MHHSQDAGPALPTRREPLSPRNLKGPFQTCALSASKSLSRTSRRQPLPPRTCRAPAGARALLCPSPRRLAAAAAAAATAHIVRSLPTPPEPSLPRSLPLQWRRRLAAAAAAAAAGAGGGADGGERVADGEAAQLRHAAAVLMPGAPAAAPLSLEAHPSAFPLVRDER